MKTLTPKQRQTGMILLAGAALAGILYLALGRKTKVEGAQEPELAAETGTPSKTVKPAVEKVKARKAEGGEVTSKPRRERKLETGSEAVMQKLDSAMDDNDVDSILKEARQLKQHPDPEVRSQVAFALSWIGLSGLSELTTMLTDPDPEVATEVLDHWRTSLAEIESDTDKGAMLGAAAEVLGDEISDEVLSDIVMECSMLDNEIALKHLADILKTVTKPEQKTEVIDAIHMCMMETDEPSEDPAVLLGQIQEELAILQAEKQDQD